MTQGQLPLEGIRVADFSWYGAGPICAAVLAHHGAQVIKVESETRPDGLRTAQPIAEGKTGYNVSGYFNNFNANKLSVTLNLKDPKAREVALRLVAVSDIAIENYTPATFDGWNFTYETFRQAKPDIIYLRAPMQGLWGPHRDFAGFGAIMTPFAGMSFLSGFPHRPPIGLGTNYTDYVINPGQEVVAIMAALHYRNRTGKGQFIEVAQIESAVAVLGPAIMDYTVNGRLQERMGNRHPYASPHGAFRCQGNDRWIAIAVFNDQEWQGLCQAMGNPEWCRDQQFATLMGRKEHEDELERLLEGWTSNYEAEEVMERLQAAGVPAGVVQNAQDVLENDPHLKVRGYYVYLDHPEAGHTAYDGPGFRLHETPGRLDKAAPCLGEHTHYVLRDILGMGEDEITQLVMDKVLV